MHALDLIILSLRHIIAYTLQLHAETEREGSALPFTPKRVASGLRCGGSGGGGSGGGGAVEAAAVRTRFEQVRARGRKRLAFG